MLDKFRETAITWDKANRKVYEPLRVSGGDNKGRKLSVQVVNGGVIENLSGASLSLFWETKDKAHKGLDAFTAANAVKGEFEIYYTTGMLSNEGTLNANLVLVDASGRVVSEPFTITVFKGIDDDAIQSEDSFTALTEALIDVSNLEQNYAPRLNDLTAQLQQTMTQQEFDSWVATILDGGPSIFFDTLTALQTTYPDGASGVALIRETDPAKIYVWNGTAWQDFGVYQGIEVKDKTVSAEKTDFAKRYKNLFDGNYIKNVIIGGDSVAGYKYTSYAGGVSLIMKIESNQTYTISRSVDTNRFGIGVFEGDPSVVINAKRMLNTPQNNTLESFTFTAGATETHLMVYLSLANELPAWVQIEKGEFATEYVSYSKLDIDVAIKNNNIVEPIKKENTTVVEKYNLLNKTGFLDEKIIDSTGVLLDFPDYSTTTKQFIKKGNYFVSAHRRFVTFTTGGVFGEEYDNPTHLDTSIIIPNDCFYQISCRDEHWDNLRVVKNDYGQLPDDTLVLANDIFVPEKKQNNYNQRFVDKNIILFGDSILRNYPDDGSIPHLIGERLGCHITNVAIGGTKIAYLTETNHTPLSGSKLLEAKINSDLSEQFTVADSQSGIQKERTLSSLNALNGNSLNYYDVGVIAYTTNDFLQSIPEGEFDKDRNTIKGAYSYFIENLLTVAPSIKLLLVSPAYQWRPDDLSFDIDEYTNNAGLKIADIVRIIKEVADYYKLEFLDNFNNAGINDFNRQHYYPSNDGIHPLVNTGIPLLANRIASKIENVF